MYHSNNLFLEGERPSIKPFVNSQKKKKRSGYYFTFSRSDSLRGEVKHVGNVCLPSFQQCRAPAVNSICSETEQRGSPRATTRPESPFSTHSPPKRIPPSRQESPLLNESGYSHNSCGAAVCTYTECGEVTFTAECNREGRTSWLEL